MQKSFREPIKMEFLTINDPMHTLDECICNERCRGTPQRALLFWATTRVAPTVLLPHSFFLPWRGFVAIFNERKNHGDTEDLIVNCKLEIGKFKMQI